MEVINIKAGSTVVHNGSLYKVLSIIRDKRPFLVGQVVGATGVKKIDLAQCKLYSVPLGKTSVIAQTGEVL